MFERKCKLQRVYCKIFVTVLLQILVLEEKTFFNLRTERSFLTREAFAKKNLKAEYKNLKSAKRRRRQAYISRFSIFDFVEK